MSFCNTARGKLERKKKAVRSKLKSGLGDFRFRISVHKSNRHFYSQVIDDSKGITIASACTLDSEMRDIYNGNANLEVVKKLAKLLSSRLHALSFESKLAFDRGAFKYVGRVAAFASVLRDDGFVF